MPIQPSTFTGPRPFARYHPGVPLQRFSDAWHRPEWRFDRATGYVEYRGMIFFNAAYGSTNVTHPLVECHMDAAPALPRPDQSQMYMTLANITAAGAPWGEVTRIDMRRTNIEGAHHAVTLNGGTSGGFPAGTWLMLNMLHSFSDSDPTFTPWRPVPVGGDGVTMTLDARWGVPFSPDDWLAQWRCTPNHSRFQWRGLLRNNGGVLGTTPPFVPVLNVFHPNPHAGREIILNAQMGNWPWQQGQVAGIRVDARPQAQGHSIDLVGTNPVNSNYYALTLDYELRPFG